ncbi:MAG: UDP-N-acetylmuramate dehydrogenase [bacterium]
MGLVDTLADIPNLVVRTEASLAQYTTFRIGGPAEILIEASSEDALLEVISLCQRSGSPVRLLGGGSNVLAADRGLEGIVLVNKVRQVRWADDGQVEVSGGFPLDEFVEILAAKGWQGLEFAAGIPGTIGGGLSGGAGAYGHLLGDYLLSATVMNSSGTVRHVPAAELGIGYRESAARERGDFILTATFHRLQIEEPRVIQEKIREIKEDRAAKHPGRDLPSAGSFFKNLPPPEPGGRRIPAGKLLDEAGVRNLCVGDAQVFEKHANIIVNRGRATSEDVNRLADEMAERVYRMHGVRLAREVLYWS